MSMFDIETIQTPYGLCVSGSASVRGAPDSALITASITRVEQKPPDAFSKVKEGARAVGNFLRESGVSDFGTSRIWLDEKWGRGEHGDMSNFLGYTASVRFKVMIEGLDQFEEIVSGMIQAGANAASVEFRTSKLKDLRMQARRLAIESAKEKATLYSEVAGVTLARIIHVQEIMNADRLGMSQIRSQYLLVDEGGKQTLDPGAIEVTAGVFLSFSLANG